MEHQKKNSSKNDDLNFCLNLSQVQSCKSVAVKRFSHQNKTYKHEDNELLPKNKYNKQKCKTLCKPSSASTTTSFNRNNSYKSGRYLSYQNNTPQQIQEENNFKIYRGAHITKTKQKRKYKKIEYHDLFQKTFDACQGYKYISFNLIKHPQFKAKQSTEKSKDKTIKSKSISKKYRQFNSQINTEQRRLKSKPITLRDSFEGQSSRFRFHQNIYQLKNMFVGNKTRQLFDRKANNGCMSKMTLVNHLGKPMRYILSYKNQ